MNINRYKDGIYILRIKIDEKIFDFKVIKNWDQHKILNLTLTEYHENPDYIPWNQGHIKEFPCSDLQHYFQFNMYWK